MMLLVFSNLKLQGQGFQGPEMTIQGKVYVIDFSYEFDKKPEYGYISIWNKANTLMHLPENPSNPDLIEYPCTPYTEDEEDWDISERTHYAEMDFLQKAFIKVLGTARVESIDTRADMTVVLYLNNLGKVQEIKLVISADFAISPSDIPALEDEIKKMEFSIHPICKSGNYISVILDVSGSTLQKDWTWRK
ncbi:MAG: hypothetical protein DDT42_02158 [candidate division WS2 bacterium]|uniref:Uncharacterized protein n=1 Tax=Psychracetigena formicireducens TaxID=2986056 RepID=A0A9E2F5K6_PSYF1|nr:hypothetical protein [Candidatus Psychracetigena formicireducens]